jgi:hypothetical protein
LWHLVEAGDARCACRAAARLVKEYDDEVCRYSLHGDVTRWLLANGDVHGQLAWKGILRAVEELRRTDWKYGERAN